MHSVKLIAVALILSASLMLGGCYSSSDATNALQASGLSDIKITGHAWLACSEDDFYATSFTATNPKGERVSGAVCSGLIFKNSTIRW